MNISVPSSDCLRIISDQLTDANVTITMNTNEYINQVSITLTREQTEDLMRKLMRVLPHSEELAHTLTLISQGKRV